MRICVINTGGTISCAGSPLAPMPAEEFAAAIHDILADALASSLPGLRLHFDTGLRFAPPPAAGMLDSTDLRPSDWCRIADRVLALYDDHDGFVILHGTDTMDYTGAALALLLNVFDGTGLPLASLSKPVILTGAQLPLFTRTDHGLMLNAGGDGLANLTGAIEAAMLRLPEVGLFFDGLLMRGAAALKVSTTRMAGFDSPHQPALARRGIGWQHGPGRPLPGPAAPDMALDTPTARARVIDQLRAVMLRIDAERIVQIPAVPADHQGRAPLVEGMIRAALEGGATGLLLEGFGAGNIPAGDGGIARLLAGAELPVMIASRAVGGQVGRFDYAAGAWIAGTGAIATGDLTPVAALAKMAVLNAAGDHHGWDARTRAALLTRALVGECSATDRFDDALRPGQALAAADGDARLENDPLTGPRLTQGGRILWQGPGPGVLRFHAGMLVLSAPDGAVLWSHPAPPAAVAVLTSAPARLCLFDPARTHPVTTALPC